MSKMSEMNKYMPLISRFYGYSLEDLDKAVNILRESVERQSLREYLELKRAKKEYLQMDALKGTYKGKHEADYEKLRTKAVKKFEEMEDYVEGAQYLVKTAEEIEEGIKFLNYNEAFKACCNIAFQIEMCHNMVIAGATFSELIKYIPGAQPGDVFHFVERYMGIKMDITAEERELIEQSEIERTIWKGTAGEGVPFYDFDEDCWRLDEDKTEYDVVGVAKKFIQAELQYPFFKDSVQPTYVNSFDEVLHALMKSPEVFSIEGVEEYYGVQERNIIRLVKEKMLEIHSRNVERASE